VRYSPFTVLSTFTIYVSGAICTPVSGEPPHPAYAGGEVCGVYFAGQRYRTTPKNQAAVSHCR
jgi:hypothetical protein